MGAVEAMLHDTARAATGLNDFGSDDYREGLERLITAVLANDPQGPGGATGLLTMLTMAPLTGRLRTEDGWRRHPSVRSDDLLPPVAIVGIPRTGTTALHGMLAVDPRFQVFENWLQQFPRPRPPHDTWKQRDDFQQVVAINAMLPEILTRAHNVAPGDADECLIPMSQTFVSNLFGSQASVPEYDEWFLAQDMTPSLRRYADVLRLVGSGSPARTWLLKNPSHVFCLDELFDVFPDARVIQTHRHPQQALGSVVSLLTGIGEGLGFARTPSDIAAREVPLWAEGMRRASAARKGRDGVFFDMDYRQFMADPLDVVHDIYATFGWELTPDVETAMKDWLDAHPQNAHGAHVYDPESLGVGADAINEHYGSYMKEFGLA